MRLAIILASLVVTSFIFSSFFKRSPKITYSEVNHFEDDKQKNWTTIFPEYISDLQYHSPPTSYKLTEKMEWGPSFALSAKNLFSNKSDRLYVNVNIYCEDSVAPEVILVASMKSGPNQVYWNGADLRNFWMHPGWNNLSLSLSVIDLPENNENLDFNTYLWNKGLRKIFADDYEIIVKHCNSLVFGFN